MDSEPEGVVFERTPIEPGTPRDRVRRGTSTGAVASHPRTTRCGRSSSGPPPRVGRRPDGRHVRPLVGVDSR